MNALLRLPAYDLALVEALDTLSPPLGVKHAIRMSAARFALQRYL